MHGRKKTIIKDGEEKLEKAKKLMGMINVLTQNKKKKLYDTTNFETSHIIVKKFPLSQTVWNYRREYFEFQKRAIYKQKGNDEITETANGIAPEVTDQNEVKKDVETEVEVEKVLGKTENTKYKNWTKQELKEQINKENMLVEQLLRNFCKSYELWFHKLWLVKFSLKSNFMNISDLFKELDFCKKCFFYDDRNFHCWNYRSYILSCIQICSSGCLNNDSLENKRVIVEASNADNIHPVEKNIEKKEQELPFDVFQENYELSKTLIERNFSNFSAWFLKYSLTESFINVKEELELIKNAMFTDPYDQSLWQYYNWLMFHRGKSKEQIWFTVLRKNEIYFFFFNLVKLDISKCKCCDESGMEIKGSWEKQIISFENEHTNKESFVFIFKIDKYIKLENLQRIRFVLHYLKYNIYHPNKVNYEQNTLQDLFKKEENSFKENKHEYIIHQEIDFNSFLKNENFQFQIYLKPKKEAANVAILPQKYVNEYFELYDCINSAKRIWNLGTCIDFNLLQQELEQINDLLDLEETCKFALLNKFAILKTLEKYNDVFKVLEVLKKTDSFRVEYYKQEEVELKIKIRVDEYYLHVKEIDEPVLDLSNFLIEDITYPILLEAFFIQRINLSNNYLSESSVGKCALNFLYNLKDLNLKNNKIKNFSLFMKNIYNLKVLEKLDVSDNVLMSLEENLETYKFVVLPSLKEINISGSNFSLLLQNKFSEVKNVNDFKVIRKDPTTVLLTV